MSLDGTRAAMTRYFNSDHSDLSMMADDVVFTTVATGEEHRGREGVARLLRHVYHEAFEATAEIRNTIFADGQAMMEADIVGRHIGEFAGVPATNRQVRVPVCVVYDLERDMIKRARVYLEIPVLMKQLGVTG